MTSDDQQDTAHTRRRPLTGPLVKSLVFVVVTVLATTVLGLSVAGTGADSDSGTTTYKALFTDVTGLVDGNSVRISGVTVGKVTDVRVVHGAPPRSPSPSATTAGCPGRPRPP
ncbi:hypothetical protein STENM223S_07709 [Streptomyces tendae]